MVSTRQSTRSIALRGTLIAVVVAAAIGGVVFVGAELLGLTPNDVVRVVATVAGAYLVLNLTILLVGLFFKPTASWAIGAALATPVILAAIGFGYVAFRSFPTS